MPPKRKPSSRPGRCSAWEGDRQCRRNGEGRLALCRIHQIALEDDPLDEVFDRLNEVTSDGVDRLIQGVRSVFDRFTQPQMRPTHARGPQPRPRPATPPPPPVQDDPRVVLGFGPGVKLTKALVKERQRALASLMHSDVGGSDEAMKKINVAAKKLLESL